MNKISTVNRAYDNTTSVLAEGVDVVAIDDPVGARFNRSLRALMAHIRDFDPDTWIDLVSACKALRWRRMSQVQPREFQPPNFKDLIEEVKALAKARSGTLDDQDLLNDLVFSAEALAESSSPVGETLLADCQDLGSQNCVIVVSNTRARLGLLEWVGPLGFSVVQPSALRKDISKWGKAFVVGAPMAYGPSLVTAPATEEVAFYMPSWFSNRRLQYYPWAEVAEGAVRPKARVFAGDVLSQTDTPESTAEIPEADLMPSYVWGPKPPDQLPKGTDLVEARKTLLAGGFATWLDDGDRIRVIDPEQPTGERVTFQKIDRVSRGTYLLLRQDDSEREAIYRASLEVLGERGIEVSDSQQRWKTLLEDRLRSRGDAQVLEELAAAGVTSPDRARAWTEPNLYRPQKDDNFKALLRWLGLPEEPYFSNATTLRKMIPKVVGRIRDQLEQIVDPSNLEQLEEQGFLKLEIESGKFGTLLASRVLSIAPYHQRVRFDEVRKPFEETGTEWLE